MAQSKIEGEWEELERRMHGYLDTYYKKHGFDAFRIGDSTGLDRNAFPFFKLTMELTEDKKSERHKFGRNGYKSNACPIANFDRKKFANLDENIFHVVKANVLAMYDPCVKLRVWNAYRYQDKEFLSQLGDAVAASVDGRQRTNLGLNRLRNFLYELQNAKVVNLVSGGERDWNSAFEIIEKLRTANPPLKSLKTAVKYLRGPSLFRRHCEKWFSTNA